MKKLLLLILLFPMALFSQVTANDASLYICDDDNDGYAYFNLNDLENDIVGTNADLQPSYYLTFQDAQNGGSNTISNPDMFQNTTAFYQMIYARVVAQSSQQFTVVEIELFVQLTPQVTPYVGIVKCDANGFSVFDLTISEITILGNQDPTQFIVSYFETLTDAESNVIPISTPQSFANTTNPQTVYVRVENMTTGCWNITSFDIAVIGCEDDEDGDLVENQYEDVDNSSNEGRSANLSNPDGNLANDDTDGDGIPNYLDNDDDGDDILTADEDYNNNGDPTDDDTNNNSIPDYLEAEVTLAVNDFERANFSMFPNPATNLVKFRLDHALVIEEAKIYAIDGSLVKTFSEKQLSANSLNVSELMSGVYFIQLKSGKSTIAKKLIVR